MQHNVPNILSLKTIWKPLMKGVRMQKKKKNANQILFKGACRVHITDKKHILSK